MMTSPKNKLEYLLNYYELLSNTKSNNFLLKWTDEELQTVLKQIQEEISKLEY